MSADFRLDGKTALVTGARTGIGQAIAAGLARFGADLVLLGRTGDLDETAELVRGEGREVETIALDLARPEAIPEAVSDLLQRRRIDILVNNAGAIRRGPVEEIDYAGWREVMAVNLDAGVPAGAGVRDGDGPAGLGQDHHRRLAACRSRAG